MNDNLAKSVRLLEGRIESVNLDGTINVILFEGGNLKDVRVAEHGTPSVPRPNKDCLILSDGAKFYCIGILADKPSASDPPPSQENIPPDKVRRPGYRELSDVNDAGEGAAVGVGAASGVVIDAGGRCASSYSSPKEQISHYCGRWEICSIGLYSQSNHDGERCWYQATWKQDVELSAYSRALTYDTDPFKHSGSCVDLKIFDSSDSGQGVKLQVIKDGDLLASIQVKASGEILVDSSEPILIKSSGKVVVESDNVFVGDEGGAVPLAKAPEVDANFSMIKNVLENHTHLYVPPQPQFAGGTAPSGPIIIPLPPLQDVGTTKVKGV